MLEPVLDVTLEAERSSLALGGSTSIAIGRAAGSRAGNQVGYHTEIPASAPGCEASCLKRSRTRRSKRSVALLLKWSASHHLKRSLGVLRQVPQDGDVLFVVAQDVFRSSRVLHPTGIHS